MGYIDTLETIEANRRFIRRAMKTDLLEAGHEMKLARRWRNKGDKAALHELTTAYLRLVIAVAARFRSYGLPLGDLVQEGSIGLMQAAARFEPARGVRFSTYATWWIRSSIQDYILRNWSIVRTGTTAAQKSLFFNLRRVRAKIAKTESATLDDEAMAKIATALRVSVKDVDLMNRRLAGGDKSLNDPVGEGGESELQDFLPDEGESPEDIVIGIDDTQARSRWLADAIETLTPREQTIIRERRLADNGVTLAELGDKLGISKERVRQIEFEALGKLREAITKAVGDPVEAGLKQG
jgi:RNA polymerase sigma-32 factor